MSSLSEVTLELTPDRRLDVIDVNQRAKAEAGDGFFERHRKTLYCSYHTTAGYLEQSLCERLGRRPGRVRGFLEPYQRLFPPEAGYHHDRLERRSELSDEQRQTEPRNADSHLTFIGGGLESCVTYDNAPAGDSASSHGASPAPVHFIDLDGVNPNGPGGREQRRRRTTLVGFDRARRVASVELEVPLSGHPIDSINLKDPSLGLYDQIEELVAQHGVRKGRLDLSLAESEEHAGLTVNEDETLLMTHDLREVLGDPLHFMAAKGWSLGRLLMRDPQALRGAIKRYAKYDLVQVVNKALDKTGLDGSVAEQFIDRFLTGPVERRLRMKRSMSLFISDSGPAAGGAPPPGGTANHGGARASAGEREEAQESHRVAENGPTHNGHAGGGLAQAEPAQNGLAQNSHAAGSALPTNGRCGHIVQGRFQSPILVQWRPSQTPTRRIVATLSRFE
jgi:thiamine phosphate synthase YjbQ (UPF0047 family)